MEEYMMYKFAESMNFAMVSVGIASIVYILKTIGAGIKSAFKMVDTANRMIDKVMDEDLDKE